MPAKGPPRGTHLRQHRLGVNRTGLICRRQGCGVTAYALRHRIAAGGTSFGFGGNLIAAFRASDQCHGPPRSIGVALKTWWNIGGPWIMCVDPIGDFMNSGTLTGRGRTVSQLMTTHCRAGVPGPLLLSERLSKTRQTRAPASHRICDHCPPERRWHLRFYSPVQPLSPFFPQSGDGRRDRGSH